MSAVPLSSDRQAAWFRALDHARLQVVKPTYHIGRDYYTVPSKRTGEIYRYSTGSPVRRRLPIAARVKPARWEMCAGTRRLLPRCRTK